MGNRKQYQKSPFNIDGSARITSPHKLRVFYKRVHTVVSSYKKPLSWLAQFAGHSKAWWGMAEHDGQRAAVDPKSGIVIRECDYEAIGLIVGMLKENSNEEDRKLRARLEVMQAQSALNEKVNALVRIR